MKYALIMLPLLALAACGDEEGIRVGIQAQANTLPTSYTTVNGDVALVDSYVVVQTAELVACPSVTTMLLKALNPLPSAMAHVETSPTLLGVPVVMTVAGEQAHTRVGSLQPPPGEYCGIRLNVGPADEDAVGLPSDDLIGRSIFVNGTDAAGAAFSYGSAATDSVQVDFSSRIVLDEDRRVATINLSVIPSFDSVDVRAETAGADTIQNFGWAVTVAT